MELAATNVPNPGEAVVWTVCAQLVVSSVVFHRYARPLHTGILAVGDVRGWFSCSHCGLGVFIEGGRWWEFRSLSECVGVLGEGVLGEGVLGVGVLLGCCVKWPFLYLYFCFFSSIFEELADELFQR